MRTWIVVGLAAAACGDNIPRTGPPLEQADHLFIGAHMDDETIFMQPNVVDAVRNSSVTTVFVASGDPIAGDGHALDLFEWAMSGYAAVAGTSDWDCGYLMVAGSPIHHCRLRGRPVSLIGLDLTDGGIEGARRESLLHLIDGTIPTLPILGPIRGDATNDSIVAELAELIVATAPTEVHTLDPTGVHGRDHSSHLMAASYAFWAMARLGYTGPLHWHRGYNVATEPVTLDGDDYEQSKWMLGFFEACYMGCAPCGTSCTTLDATHEIWLRRQYGTTRDLVPGTLATIEGACLAPAPDGAALADCTNAYQLRNDGRLTTGDGTCLASTAAGAVVAEPCDGSAAQYWMLDGEGFVWNGRLPQASANMDYDHVRCLSADPVGAPTCGASRQARWQLHGVR